MRQVLVIIITEAAKGGVIYERTSSKCIAMAKHINLEY